jgi:hypothetical protein
MDYESTLVIESIDNALLALGGTQKAATLMGVSPQAVSNWRKRGLPWRVYPLLEAKLRPYGIAPHLCLFGRQQQKQEMATAADSQEVDAAIALAKVHECTEAANFGSKRN